jgi:hypothetical protein
MKQYVQTDLDADRQVATTLTVLIIGDSLVQQRSARARERRERAPVHKSVHKLHAEGPFSVRERASGLGSGGGI